MTAATLNRRLKRWPGWLALGVVVAIALAIGASRAGGPQSDDDRTNSITERLACPECDGESVYESRSPAADTIRRQVKSLVQQGQFSDDQIITYISDDAQYGAKTLLVPKASGFDSLVWMLPVIAAVCAVAGLAVAFRRWKQAADTVPTDADRELVDSALQVLVDEQ